MDVSRTRLQTQLAFDGVAAGYARSNAVNTTLCAMRTRAWRAVDAFVPRRSHILDLGCGPGTDAVRFAGEGYRVTAIDLSSAMVAEAKRRTRAAAVHGRVSVLHLGIHEIDQLMPDTVRFDAAYSNFGPLNCVEDLPAAARLIAAKVRPGGVLIASVIGRVCPWEVALYLSRGDWRRAAVRFHRGPVPVPLEGLTVWTRYYTPSAFEKPFRAVGFSRASLCALGLLAPPPYLQAFAERHPAVVGALQSIDDRVGGWPGLRAWGDHFLIVLRKE